MATFRIPRPGQVDLAFNGTLLTDQSSQDDRPRWTEIRIYRTESGKWVTEQVGRSEVRGEVDRYAVAVCDTPVTVRTSLQPNGYLTELALEALDRAAEADPDLGAITTEWV